MEVLNIEFRGASIAGNTSISQFINAVLCHAVVYKNRDTWLAWQVLDWPNKAIETYTRLSTDIHLGARDSGLLLGLFS